MGEDYYPMPWPNLKYDTRLGGYRVGVTEDQLKGAPKFNRNTDWDWNCVARASGQPYGPLQLSWSRFYRPSLGCFRVARARRHAIFPRVPADRSRRAPPCVRTSRDFSCFRSYFHTSMHQPL